jgi:hypothetical protein
MINIGTNSIYAKVGLVFAVLMLSFHLISDYAVVKEKETRIYQNIVGLGLESVMKELGNNTPKTDPAKSKVPCYTVEIDPTVDGFDDTRSAVFGESIMDGTDGFLAELEIFLIDEFTRTVWNGRCFEGSFVVSFNVDEDGSLGHTIIVHHLRKGGVSVSHGIYQMLYELDHDGHRWHDGTRGAGEVRIPVRFRIG